MYAYMLFSSTPPSVSLSRSETCSLLDTENLLTALVGIATKSFEYLPKRYGSLSAIAHYWDNCRLGKCWV